MLGGVERQADVGELGGGERAGRLGREQQPEAAGGGGRGHRLLLRAVLVDDVGQVSGVPRVGEVEQRRLGVGGRLLAGPSGGRRPSASGVVAYVERARIAWQCRRSWQRATVTPASSSRG